MTQIEKESILKKSPLITIEKTEIILKQMKESICKIKNVMELDFFVKY